MILVWFTARKCLECARCKGGRHLRDTTLAATPTPERYRPGSLGGLAEAQRRLAQSGSFNADWGAAFEGDFAALWQAGALTPLWGAPR